MVVYAPPYSENPNAAVLANGPDDPRLQADAADISDVPDGAEAIGLPHYRGVACPACRHTPDRQCPVS